MRRAAVVLPILLILLIVAASAQIGSPLAVDPKGQVYFAGNGAVWKIAADGSVTKFVTGKNPTTLALDAQGNLCGNHQFWDARQKQQLYSLWSATPEGKVTDIVAPTAALPRGTGCLQDEAGNTYAWVGSGDHRQAESYLLRRTPEGEVSVVAGGAWGHRDGLAHQAQFASVGGMAVGPGGAIYVADEDSIRMILPSGMVTTIAQGSVLSAFPQSHKLGSLNPMSGLAVDERGAVYVAHFSNGTVLKVTPGGQVATLLQLDWRWGPVGVAVAGTDVFVLEEPNTPFTDGPRVQWLAPNGQVLTLASLPQSRSTLGMFVVGLLALVSFGIIVLLILARPRRSPAEAPPARRAA